MSRAQRGPFGRRFLHPALTEIALAGSDQRSDFRNGVRLGDGNQRDVGRITFGPNRGTANLLANQRQAGISSFGQNLKAVPT